ncbi:MAG: immunoglobulin domain-containing protein [Methanothrix sp.]|nr:immunoglobulin domain-containing protein [Methanothrix sp.]
MNKRRVIVLCLTIVAALSLNAIAAWAVDPYYPIAEWGSFGSGNGQFKHPYGVAVDRAGNVYVADTENHRIQKFNSSGGFLNARGSLGSGLGQFNYPGGVAVDGAGNVYVADTGNNRIQKFYPSGGIDVWGSQGSGLGQLLFPEGLAVDGCNNVYVADTGNDRIQKFYPSGGIDVWGSLGSGLGQFDSPMGVAVDGAGNVYVADTDNNRIQKFSPSGTIIEVGSLGSEPGQFRNVWGVAVDGAGNVYVADRGNSRIQLYIYFPELVPLTWGSLGSGNGQFMYPNGVAVDGAGNVYVADTENNRIQKFGSSRPKIIVEPLSKTIVFEGQTATLSVVSTGIAPLSFQWQKNGVNITGATSSTYKTPATTLADSGSTFRCVVSNSAGSVTSNAATLTVVSTSSTPPSITSQPTNKTVVAGQTATFSITATGTPPLYYQWQKNGSNITGATSSSYTTPATALADSGSTFRCVVHNSVGSVTSNAATLTVNPATATNLIVNPGFETGTTPWVFYTNGVGTFKNDVAGPASLKAGHIVITTAGTNVQLYQKGITLVANTRYRLSFKAKSNTGHDLSVRLLKGVSPYTNYGLNTAAFNLTSSWAGYSVEFTTTGFTGTVSDGQLQFWLAPYDAAGDQYYIDDVVLQKI